MRLIKQKRLFYLFFSLFLTVIIKTYIYYLLKTLSLITLLKLLFILCLHKGKIKKITEYIFLSFNFIKPRYLSLLMLLHVKEQ